MFMSQIVEEMISAGVHLGHRQRNPKMKPYIYTEKDDLQIINLFQTYKFLKRASLFLLNECREGKRVLFVGTKKHIAKCIEQTANECNSWYINKRWLGGLLTNWGRKRNYKNYKNKYKTKKELAQQERQKKRHLKYLGGVSSMYKRPDIVVIVGQQKEMNAVRECQKLRIPSLTILDTNGDPTLTDFFIPANDDSDASVRLILNQLSKAIQKGQGQYQYQRQRQRQKDFQRRQRQQFKKTKNVHHYRHKFFT